MTAQQPGMGLEKGSVIRGHEFHYYDSDDNGDAFHAVKSHSKKSWDCCYLEENLYAGCPHTYLPSCPALAGGFVRAASNYKGGSRC